MATVVTGTEFCLITCIMSTPTDTRDLYLPGPNRKPHVLLLLLSSLALDEGFVLCAAAGIMKRTRLPVPLGHDNQSLCWDTGLKRG